MPGGYQGPARWGGQFDYSDTAIQCLLTLRAVFHLPLRATQGIARSVFELMGLDLAVPHYSTLCRRAADAPDRPAQEAEGPLHLVLDSTGLKVYGEGEWKVRKHGYSKRRTWRKLHLAIDPETHEIQAAVVTEPGVDRRRGGPPLLEQVDRAGERCGGRRGLRQAEGLPGAGAPHGPAILIPPRRDARIWKHGNAAGPPLARDENLRQIRRSAARRGSRSRATTCGRWPRRRCSG